MRATAFAIILLSCLSIVKLIKSKKESPANKSKNQVSSLEVKPQVADILNTKPMAPLKLNATKASKIEVKAASTAPSKTAEIVRQDVTSNLAAPTAEVASTPIQQEVATQQAAPKSSNSFAPVNMMTGEVNSSGSPFSGSLSMGYSSNLYEKTAAESQAFGTYSMRLDYQVKKTRNVIRGFMSGYKEQNQGQENKLNDGFLAWVNGSFWRKGEIASVGQQIRLSVPASKESIKRDEKITGITVAPIVILNLTPVGLTGVTLVMLTQATKNFHKYEQNRAFGNNTSMSLAEIFSLNWSVTDHFYFRNDFVYGLAWSYGGVKRDDIYQFASEIGYSWNNGIVLGGGVSNTGAIRNLENGNDQTIQLFDNKTASVYTELSYFF